DVDEYIYDFKTVATYLKSYWYLTIFPSFTPIAFKGKYITLFKEVSGGFLYLDSDEHFSFITNQSEYIYVRKNNRIRNHFSNIKVIHRSWARSEDEIKMKMNNWGHKDDFDTQSYFKFWKILRKENFNLFQDVHPIEPGV